MTGVECFYPDNKIMMYPTQEFYEMVLFKVTNRAKEVGKYLQDKIVLSVGCGSGFSESIWKDSAKLVVGLDINEEAIDYAKKNYDAVNLMFYVYDVKKGLDPEDKLFDAEEFDVVVSTEFLEHISKEDGEAFVKEVVRFLKPEGLFLGTTPNNQTGVMDSNHLMEYSYFELQELLVKNFDRVEIDQLTVLAPSFFWRCWR